MQRQDAAATKTIGTAVHGLGGRIDWKTVYAGIKEVDQRLVERVNTLGGGRSILSREVYLRR